jgi:plasmid stabilization system protein ParE
VKLLFTGRALDDLSRLRAFITKDNPHAARRFSQVLRGSIGHLADHPQMGEALDAPAGVRRWVAGPYVVHYAIDGQTLIVLRIWHGREQRTQD